MTPASLCSLATDGTGLPLRRLPAGTEAAVTAAITPRPVPALPAPSQSSQPPTTMRSSSLRHAAAVGSSGGQTPPAWPQNLRTFHFWATIIAIYFFMCLPFSLCYSVPFYGIPKDFSYATWVLCSFQAEKLIYKISFESCILC